MFQVGTVSSCSPLWAKVSLPDGTKVVIRSRQGRFVQVDQKGEPELVYASALPTMPGVNEKVVLVWNDHGKLVGWASARAWPAALTS